MYLSAMVCALSAFAAHAQAPASAQQDMQAVQDHLSRYVVLKGAQQDEMDLASQMKALRVPAVSIAAIKDGGIDWARAYGSSSPQGLPASTSTLFGAASISKPVTAVGVLKLVEAGKINLDVDVNQYLKRWKIPDNHPLSKNGER